VKGYLFIFSNRNVYFISRHLAFWIVFIMHYGIQNILIGGYREPQHYRTLPELLLYILFFVPTLILSSYFFMYVILPDLLFKNKIKGFLISFFGLILFNGVTAYFIGRYYIHLTQQIPYGKIDFDLNKYNTIVNGFWIPLIVLLLSGGIRLTKKWIMQEKANTLLAKQKISRELKLLKTQIHPRFLFHSLYSLEENLRAEKADSPVFILKLADLLSYVLYESEGEYALLEKEIEVIREYLDLQKDNFKDSLHTSLDIHIQTANAYIAPLILLPLLETSFEYLLPRDTGARHMQIEIKADNEMLIFNLTFFEKNTTDFNFPRQSVWADITRRVENLYPNNHQLLLKTNKNDILIELRLNLMPSVNALKSHPYALHARYEYA
jgi:sensor histidine kinase YesM